MIEQSQFLGFALQSRRQRRRLVIFFYLIVTFLALAALLKGHSMLSPLVTFTLLLGGLLGGIKGGGPVKPYAVPPLLPLDQGDELQQLGLGNSRRTPGTDWDERETAARDAAHFLAFRILRWGLAVASLAYLAALGWFEPWVERKSPILLWILLVIVLSLPQAVILWREPSDA